MIRTDLRKPFTPKKAFAAPFATIPYPTNPASAPSKKRAPRLPQKEPRRSNKSPPQLRLLVQSDDGILQNLAETVEHEFVCGIELAASVIDLRHDMDPVVHVVL